MIQLVFQDSLKRNKTRRTRAFLLLASAPALTGCSLALSSLAARSAAFGNAARVVVRDSSDAYDTVERVTYDANVSSLVLDFDADGFDRDQIRPFLPPHDLAVRQSVLRGLQSYADDLAQVAGDQAFAPVDQQVSALSANLEKLSVNGELGKLAPKASSAEIQGFSTALDALAKVLIERKRRKELPRVIAKMQPVLEQLCSLLQRDLGDRPVDGKGGSGLRDQLWNEYDDIIDNQTDYIADNKAVFSPSEKAIEIAKLPALVRRQRTADAALASTQAALRDLVEAHRTLLEPAAAGTFRAHLGDLIQDGQQIGQFYESLRTN